MNKLTGPQLAAAKQATAAATKAHDDAVNAKTVADNNLTKANNNKAAADQLVADAQAAMDTADALVDEKVPSYIKHDDNQGTTTDDNGSTTNVNTPTDNEAARAGAVVTIPVSTGAATATTPATMTRAQYRAQLNSAAKQNALPQTSNEDSVGIMALGTVSAMFGLGLAARKREA